MKNPIRNRKGIALISTLMLLVLGLMVVAILMRLVTQETKLARLEQGYSTALDAAKGGADAFIFIAQNGLALGIPPTPPFAGTFNNAACLRIKMTNPTASWTIPAWTTAACPSATSTTYPSAISSDLATHPDMADISFIFGTYTVYLKIIDNSPTQGNDAPPCPNGCNYYTVLSSAQNAATGQHADVQFVYRLPQ